MGRAKVIRKYDALDERLLQWLRENTQEVTTTAAAKALDIKCDIARRHISRRFTILEGIGALVCTLQGKTRVCTVNLERLPPVLHRGGPNNRSWRRQINTAIVNHIGHSPTPSVPNSQPSIPAKNSQEFEAAGGYIERLPSQWDHEASRRPIGSFTFLDHISELD